jgi:hypothetical protein
LKIFRRPKSKEYWKFKTVNILKIMGRKTKLFQIHGNSCTWLGDSADGMVCCVC